MLKTLVKKQLYESFGGGNRATKKGKKAKTMGQGIPGVILTYLALFVFIGLSMASLEGILFYELHQMDLDWLFFSFIGIASLSMGLIGSVFTTYTALYKSKDNDLLLSMPIKPSIILFARMISCYGLALYFSAVIFAPGVIMAAIQGAGIKMIIGSILVMIITPFFTLSISMILAWIIAWVMSKVRVKSKSLITVACSITFLVLYYVFIFRLNDVMDNILANASSISMSIMKKIAILYHLGNACTGNVLSLLILALFCLGIFGIIYYVVQKNFIKLVTSSRGEKKEKYVKKASKKTSVEMALFKRELSFFKQSPTYILNGALASVFLLVAAVALVIKASYIQTLGSLMGLEMIGLNLGPIFMIGAMGMSSMNMLSAASVSLEGNKLWIARSNPVETKKVLYAKVALHFVMTAIPVMIFSIVGQIVAMAPTYDFIFGIITPILFAFVSAQAGLIVNLLLPKLDWTNEVTPIKQGAATVFSMLVNLLLGVGSAYLGFKMYMFFDLKIAYIILFAALALIAFLEYLWIVKRGTKRFERL